MRTKNVLAPDDLVMPVAKGKRTVSGLASVRPMTRESLVKIPDDALLASATFCLTNCYSKKVNHIESETDVESARVDKILAMKKTMTVVVRTRSFVRTKNYVQ